MHSERQLIACFVSFTFFLAFMARPGDDPSAQYARATGDEIDDRRRAITDIAVEIGPLAAEPLEFRYRK